MSSVQSEKYGLSPEEIEKERYLVKDLEQFLIRIEKRKQKYFWIDLGTIRKIRNKKKKIKGKFKC